MARSSGGGSSSGGSRSSSSSSRSSSSSSGGSYSCSARKSDEYFSNARTFVVYDKKKEEYDVVYADFDYSSVVPKRKSLLFGFIIAGAIFIFMLFALYFGTVFSPVKNDYSDIDSEILIMDEYDLLTDSEEREILKSLEKFKEKTGVIPAINIVDKEIMDRNFKSIFNTDCTHIISILMTKSIG